jgi:hypothetical protein
MGQRERNKYARLAGGRELGDIVLIDL